MRPRAVLRIATRPSANCSNARIRSKPFCSRSCARKSARRTEWRSAYRNSGRVAWTAGPELSPCALTIVVQPAYILSAYCVQHGAHRLARFGVLQRRVEFRQRFENETSLAIAGMRDGELHSVHDGISVKQDVDINGARTIDHNAPASQSILPPGEFSAEAAVAGTTARSRIPPPDSETRADRAAQQARFRTQRTLRGAIGDRKPVIFREPVRSFIRRSAHIRAEPQIHGLQNSSGCRSTPPKWRGTLK